MTNMEEYWNYVAEILLEDSVNLINYYRRQKDNIPEFKQLENLWNKLEKNPEHPPNLFSDLLLISSAEFQDIRIILWTWELFSTVDELLFIEKTRWVIRNLENSIKILYDKDKQYGSSWKKRGGIGAFLVLARKYDRIINHVNFILDGEHNATMKPILLNDDRQESIIHDIQDLRLYFTLVEAHRRTIHKV